MKRTPAPLEVTIRGGKLVRIREGGTLHRVLSVSDFWNVRGRWWDADEEEERNYLRVVTDRGLLEIYQRLGEGSWHLARRSD